MLMSDDKKHILYLSSWYPNRKNPFLGNFVQRQARLLAEEYNVTVIHTVSDPLIKDQEIFDQTEGNLREILIYHHPGKNTIQKGRIQKNAISTALDMVTDVDLMMTQTVLPKGWQFVMAHKKFNCPWIHYEQGSYFRDEARKEWSLIDKWIIRKVRKGITRYLTSSEFVRTDIMKVFTDVNVGVVPNHVDTELFKLMPRRPEDNITRFLHISTLDPKTKNPKGLFDAVQELHVKRGNIFELLVISDEPTEIWENYCNEIGISEVVKFEGPKDWEELPEYYSKSDAFLLNSVYETFSIVLVEAWACGRPVITTPVGVGCDLPDELGYNTVINDPANVAMLMEKFIDCKGFFHEEKIREAGLKYSGENVLAKLKLNINAQLGIEEETE